MTGLLQSVSSSDTGKAAGLAVAMIGNNIIALVASIVFARLPSDYGALAALISYLMILTVVGQALQVYALAFGWRARRSEETELLGT